MANRTPPRSVIPPLHALAAFEAVARTGSFTAAADELYVTRSAVSHRIRELEVRIGVALFRRGGAAAEMTEAGQAYRDAVGPALAALQKVATAPLSASSKRITLGTPPTFAREVLLPRLPAFHAMHPDIDVDLRITVPMLESAHDADVEIRFGARDPRDPDDAPLLDEPVFVVGAPDYLKRLPSLTSPNAIARATLLRSTLEPWRPWFAAAGLDWNEPTGGDRYDDLALLYRAAEQGLGLALARRTLASRALHDGTLERVLALEARSPHAYWLVSRDDTRARAEVAAFARWLRAAVAATPPA
jgi:LysR family transcriptional regulator, glycine cleavage system transcriptional activator